MITRAVLSFGAVLAGSEVSVAERKGTGFHSFGASSMQIAVGSVHIRTDLEWEQLCLWAALARQKQSVGLHLKQQVDRVR